MSISFSSVIDHIRQNGLNPIDDIAKLIIRPPRATYPLSALGPPVFRVQACDDQPCAQIFQRHDLTLESMRGLTLQCSWYRPLATPGSPPAAPPPPPPPATGDDDGAAPAAAAAPPAPPAGEIARPCVVYIAGNAGSRLDGQSCLYLLERGFSLFTYDSGGSGLSGGEYVSLGVLERQDLAAVVDYLRASRLVTTIGLWGRSMGAATALMYTARDASIAVLVLDSPFSSLRLLIADLVEQLAQWVPTFAVDALVEKVRRRIIRHAAFDIDDVDAVSAAALCHAPCFIIHGRADTFVRPAHSELVASAYQGSCLRHEVEGGHNDERLSDARDVALQLLTLYLIDKPLAEARAPRPAPQREPLPPLVAVTEEGLAAAAAEAAAAAAAAAGNQAARPESILNKSVVDDALAHAFA
jgi:pimeloyl-ACP methyl ester carboxylesterase